MRIFNLIWLTIVICIYSIQVTGYCHSHYQATGAYGSESHPHVLNYPYKYNGPKSATSVKQLYISVPVQTKGFVDIHKNFRKGYNDNAQEDLVIDGDDDIAILPVGEDFYKLKLRKPNFRRFINGGIDIHEGVGVNGLMEGIYGGAGAYGRPALYGGLGINGGPALYGGSAINGGPALYGGSAINGGPALYGGLGINGGAGMYGGAGGFGLNGEVDIHGGIGIGREGRIGVQNDLDSDSLSPLRTSVKIRKIGGLGVRAAVPASGEFLRQVNQGKK